MNILLVAEESAGLRALRAIDKRNDNLVAVLTSPVKNEGSSLSVGKLARQLNYEVWCPEWATDPALGDRIRESGIDVLLNVHSLQMLNPSAIDAPRIGSFNLHPGPLPQLAGLNAPSWAVYLGAKHHAVTVHWMDAGIDTGPIAYSASFELTDNDTGLSVSSKCVALGMPLIDRLLDTATRNPTAIPAHTQDTSMRRLFKGSDIPNSGRIKWSNNAREITAFVRAADYGPLPSPWGSPQTRLEEIDLGVVKARMTGEPADAAPGQVLFAAGDEVCVAARDEIVAVQQIKIGDRTCSASEVIAAGQVLR